MHAPAKSRKPTLHERITEQANPASAALDTKSTREILRIINREDHLVAPAVRKVIPQIGQAVGLAVEAIQNGGRLIYLGAGTSGRLGVLDAAECMPTYGTDSIIALLAGSPGSLVSPVEDVEDDDEQAQRDLKAIGFSKNDLLVGISASGRAPYVMGGMRFASARGAKVVALTCNPEGTMNALADVAIVPVVGPEVVAGSSRMKAGTAQKLVLNMLSTTAMVKLGRVLSNRMINVQLTNEKIRKRAGRILSGFTGLTEARAMKALTSSGGSLPVAMLMSLRKISAKQAARELNEGKNIATVLRQALKRARD